MASNTIIYNNVSVHVYSGGMTSGNTTISPGGVSYVETERKLEDNVVLNPCGSATIALSNGGYVDLIGNNSGVTISGYVAGVNTSVPTIIDNFSGL